ncbi:TetR/AcrR family transcriptional regulator [Rhodococcus sp. NPDC003318]|uniref:TetR/AcrR family transcriptional regulator n=1 Tax=Rhodococcus sp. NPDC003318 TaxID=3364503 RepID=UPI0036C593A7
MSTNRTIERRRPKDRKGQILAAARTRFVEMGYRNVSMAQIAEDVGITAGALYRHFRNKSVLVAAVIESSFDVLPPFGRRGEIAAALADASDYVAEHRDLGALWWREMAYVPPEAYVELQGRLGALNRRCADLVRDADPALPDADAIELAWGVHAILASASWHSTRIDRTEFATVLQASCAALLATDLPAVTPVAARASALEVVSKRERLLSHAITMFDQKGFDATLDEIGAAAGVTGPSLYSHFHSKGDVLAAAIERSTNALWLLLHSALREAGDVRDALSRLVHGYVGIAVDKTIMTAVLQMEQSALPDVLRSRQREYLAEWTALLRLARPELTETQARVLVHTSLGVVNTLARIDDLRISQGGAARLAAMALSVLLDADLSGTDSGEPLPQ